MATRNTNPTYIADTGARIRARNEAAAIHMDEQAGLRRGMSKLSLGAANALDRVGALFADAMAAGVAGGVFGAFMGALVGAMVVAISSVLLPAAFAFGTVAVAGFSGLFAITGFATEYTRIKANNPEKKNAARADWLATKGGALDKAGFQPPKPRAKGPYAPPNPGNGVEVDAATVNARADRERAQSTVDRVAPNTPPPGSGGQPAYSPGTDSTFSAEGHAGFQQKENLRRGLATDTVHAAPTETQSHVERFTQRDQQSPRSPSI